MTHFTTIEQSKALIKAGLNPESADMYYFSVGLFPPIQLKVGKISDVVESKRCWAIPCWSTGTLIDLLPFEICIAGNKNLTYQLRLGKGKNEFWITYESQIADLKGAYIGFNTAIDKCDMADCVYKMVMFCLEKGFIKKAESCE